MILHLGLHPGTVLGSTSPITSTDYRYFKVVSSHLLINQRKVLSILAAELLYIITSMYMMNFWGNCASGGVVSWILTASLLCWSGWCAGEEGSLAITSCSPPPCSPQGPRTSILQPILAGTALHMLLWLPICMEHRLSLQKCRWLHLEEPCWPPALMNGKKAPPWCQGVGWSLLSDQHTYL